MVFYGLNLCGKNKNEGLSFDPTLFKKNGAAPGGAEISLAALKATGSDWAISASGSTSTEIGSSLAGEGPLVQGNQMAGREHLTFMKSGFMEKLVVTWDDRFIW